MFNMTKSISPVCFIIDNHRALFLFTEKVKKVHIYLVFINNFFRKDFFQLFAASKSAYRRSLVS
jgi:hypothetical protein